MRPSPNLTSNSNSFNRKGPNAPLDESLSKTGLWKRESLLMSGSFTQIEVHYPCGTQLFQGFPVSFVEKVTGVFLLL